MMILSVKKYCMAGNLKVYIDGEQISEIILRKILEVKISSQVFCTGLAKSKTNRLCENYKKCLPISFSMIQWRFQEN